MMADLKAFIGREKSLKSFNVNVQNDVEFKRFNLAEKSF
jgi:hypothetical protein